MNTSHTTGTHSSAAKPGFVQILACKCPRCRQGDMFVTKNPWKLKKTLAMYEKCPVCDQVFNIEIGFYYGSSYVSYGASLLLAGLIFVAWYLLIGFSPDIRFYYWLVVNTVLLIVLQPYLMRVARTGWLAFFVPYDKNWRINPPLPPERVNKDQENNW
jgi:uncharacterized protein (DUF983 family)